MIEHIASFFATLRQSSPKFLTGISIACGAIIFLPENVISALGLIGFRSANKGYIGGIFLVTACLLTAQFGYWCIKSLSDFRAKKRMDRIQKDHLSNLTPDEKAYLKPFVVEEVNTQYFGIQDGIAGGLDSKGIIYRSSNVGNLLAGIAYNIQPWAKKHLKENPYLLEGANPSLPSQQKIWMR